MALLTLLGRDMNILIIGRGWVGQKLASELEGRGAAVTMCSHADALGIIRGTVPRKPYKWVINCAGVVGSPNVDACELDKLGTYRGNTLFPIELAFSMSQLNWRFAHLSSGCIYSGEHKVGDDPDYFGSTYSISKLLSDEFLKSRAVVFRIRMPFGDGGERDYLSKVKRYASTAKLWDGGRNSLTEINEAVKKMADLIIADVQNGAYNLVNPGGVTMHELAAALDIEADWFSDEEFSVATKAGRSTCVLECNTGMRPIMDALNESQLSPKDKNVTQKARH